MKFSLILILGSIFIINPFSNIKAQNDFDVEDNTKKQIERYFFSIPYWDDEDYQIEKREAIKRGNFYKVLYYSEARPEVLQYYHNMRLQYVYLYNENRVLKKREAYKDGIPDGYWFEYINIRYFPHVKRKIYYDNGKITTTTLYTHYSNGKIKSEENFSGNTNFRSDSEQIKENSIRDGYTRIYDKYGNILYEAYFNNGKIDGEERIVDFSGFGIEGFPINKDNAVIKQIKKYKPDFDSTEPAEVLKQLLTINPNFISNGKMRSIKRYDDDVLDLQSTDYDYLFDGKNLKIINAFFDKGNELRRDIIVKDKFGRIVKITKWKDGDKEYGLWEFYDQDNRLIKTQRYKDGTRNGEWQDYEYINNERKIIKVETYKNDELVTTKNLQYNQNTGKRLKEENYKDGLPNGDWYYYDDNHNLIKKEEYDSGVPDGIWLYWTVLKDGRLETQRYIIYRNGEITQTKEYEYDEDD